MNSLTDYWPVLGWPKSSFGFLQMNFLANPIQEIQLDIAGNQSLARPWFLQTEEWDLVDTKMGGDHPQSVYLASRKQITQVLEGWWLPDSYIHGKKPAVVP